MSFSREADLAHTRNGILAGRYPRPAVRMRCHCLPVSVAPLPAAAAVVGEFGARRVVSGSAWENESVPLAHHESFGLQEQPR